MNRENPVRNSPDAEQSTNDSAAPKAPSISLPKGGGAIRGIDEKFGANPVTGTGSLTIPIALSPGRSGLSPQLSLSYDSGAGNGPFGLGWDLPLPSITRKTDKGLPKYQDVEESDVFILSGAEDLVPLLIKDGDDWRPDVFERTVDGVKYQIKRYRPRIEGLFARIERWTNITTSDTHWRSISTDNIITFYGRKPESRIADPTDAKRVFSWLICEVRDDQGNALVYEYVPEDSRQIDLALAHERNRDSQSRSANRYLKRIKYGNKTSHLVQSDLSKADWLFEVVFDYDEGHEQLISTTNRTQFVNAGIVPARAWTVRDDPFSTFRAGFEIRTYRLCRSILMFHHFPEELNTDDYLVGSTEFNYQKTSIASFITSVTHSSHVRQADGIYLKQSLPPAEFEYSKAVIQNDVHEIDAENLPYGVDGANYQFVDLDGEGVSGILTDQGSAWFYKPNIGDGRFGPVQLVAIKPTMGDLNSDQRLLDLAADGQLDLVHLTPSMSGFHERLAEDGWSNFKPFPVTPNVDWHDPNLRFVDLTGDGHADILVAEGEVLTWYPSLAEEGFGPSEKLRQSLDEEKGPHVVFADGTESIIVADMSGDGLGDLVRIRNGEICYWPNLGYGRFGAKVTMDIAPWFDAPDQFDQNRIRLADVDGSGVTDIIYLKSDGISVYFNQSGNSWSEAQQLNLIPDTSNVSSITVADLLGDGTACLVWSSPLPGHSSQPMRYVKLMEQKPHLLTVTKNNVGGETRVQYAASTKFYLADKAQGKPWITRLPFPVYVVERVESLDHISRNRFVSRYTYHHGYFDGEEREFRGFGMVEQFDTEAFADFATGVRKFNGGQEQSSELFQPPVTTRTWYHTGAFTDRSKILHQFSDEYYRKEQLLPDVTLPPGLNADEFRECLRALKGSPLRQEVYSFDGSPRDQNPYTIIENNYQIKQIQPRVNQRHGAFFAVGRESVSFNYERDPADPRIAHTLGLELDEFGNVRKSGAVVYGRKVADPLLPPEVTHEQEKLYITYSEADYTPDIDRDTAYRLRVGHEARSYEVTGVSPANSLFEFDEIKTQIAGCAAIDYEVIADGVTPQKRLLSHSRALFLDNNLNPLPLGQWDSLGLPHQNFQLAFTPGVTNIHYEGKVTDLEFAAAGYVHFNGDNNWWIPSGTSTYPANPAAHFFLPMGAKDPLGVETITALDKYDLLVERVQMKQATWNETTAVNDYRVLGPVLVTDPNKNRMAVEIDALGMVVKSAVMGKAGRGEGDTLADPTVRMEYELFNWMDQRKPNLIHTFAREQHGAANPRWQESYSYSNGSGGVALVKRQAHPGKALKVNPDGSVTEVNADPRWVGNGRTVLNNKGNAVKEYEPYFSTTHEYEDESAVREIGVTPILFYDPVGRNIRTQFPNGTFIKVEFDSWMQRGFDTNDTVKESQWYVDRGSPDPTTEPEPVNNPERRAAWLAAKHADTPAVNHFDSVGRSVYGITDFGGGKKSVVRSETDLTGRLSRMFDQAQREVFNGFTGMLGTPVVGETAEKGRRWIFQNVLGAMVKTWDEHGRQFRTEHDVLHRPVSVFVLENRQPEFLCNHVLYGDRLPNAEQLNLLGVTEQIFDQAGVMRVPEMDFKGNPKRVERVLAKDYENSIDWKTLLDQPELAKQTLEVEEVFTASSEYDALNRPTRATLPDGTVILPRYNEASFLASLQAQIGGRGKFIEFLKDQDYDAKGQRQFAHYGNEVFTRYFYDPKTFSLTNLVTFQSGADPDTRSLQNLRYTYDPVGNITQIRDDAQQTHYFQNAVVKPENRYEYDATYQLIRATGRELAGIVNDNIRTDKDLDFIPQLPHANDINAVRTYTEDYEYDLLGNIKTLRHRFSAKGGIGSGWTRRYHYAHEDEPTNRTNRLTSSSLPGDPDDGPYSAKYDYDAYGNMTRMPHLANMDWDFMDQLRQVDLGGGGTAYYVYGMGGQRLRKVIERNGNVNLEWIFLGPVMIFRRRRRDTDELRFERWTIDISDNVGNIAQIDTKTRDDDNTDPANPLNTALIRYQYANHLGSAVLETDDIGNVISYEEYHPYGTTSYRSAKPGFDLSLKRYRFSGKERDDETGLYYFGVRYYASWLGRWTSSDPGGFVDGLNLFQYARNNPSTLNDPVGFAAVSKGQLTAVDKRYVTGKESLGELKAIPVPKGRIFNPLMTEENLSEWYIPGPDKDGAGGIWALWVQLPTDSGAGDGCDSGEPETEPPPDIPIEEEQQEPEAELSSLPSGAREVLQESAHPESIEGVRGQGTTHTYSGSGKTVVDAQVREPGGGNSIDYIEGQPSTEYAEAMHAEENILRGKAPGTRLTTFQRIRIWGVKSFKFVFKAAFSRHAVDGVGPTTLSPSKTGFIRGAFENPARIIGGGLAGALMIGTGIFNVYAGAHESNRTIGNIQMTAGTAEAISGALYGAAQVLNKPGVAKLAGVAGRAFGGIGAAVGFGVAAYRAYKHGDTAGMWFNGVGAVGGVLLTAAAFFPPAWAIAGTALAVAGTVAILAATGHALYRWLNSR